MTECQVCSFLVVDGPDPVVNAATLRFEGWRIYDGLSESGREVNVRICPTCSYTPRPPRPGPVLAGQEELF